MKHRPGSEIYIGLAASIGPMPFAVERRKTHLQKFGRIYGNYGHLRFDKLLAFFPISLNNITFFYNFVKIINNIYYIVENMKNMRELTAINSRGTEETISVEVDSDKFTLKLLIISTNKVTRN